MPITDNLVWACSTAFETPCLNSSPGWTQIQDIAGNPPATNTTYQCPPNGRCSYEIWTKNAIGRSWIIGHASPGAPVEPLGDSEPRGSGSGRPPLAGRGRHGRGLRSLRALGVRLEPDVRQRQLDQRAGHRRAVEPRRPHGHRHDRVVRLQRRHVVQLPHRLHRHGRRHRRRHELGQRGRCRAHPC